MLFAAIAVVVLLGGGIYGVTRRASTSSSGAEPAAKPSGATAPGPAPERTSPSISTTSTATSTSASDPDMVLDFRFGTEERVARWTPAAGVRVRSLR